MRILVSRLKESASAFKKKKKKGSAFYQVVLVICVGIGTWKACPEALLLALSLWLEW